MSKIHLQLLGMTFLFLLASSHFIYSQSKDKLINSILKSEMLESDCVGIGCSKGEQYLNFEKLLKIVSEKELIEFSKHKNPFLRMYVSMHLIDSNKASLFKMFKYELEQNEIIPIIEGYLLDDKPTYEILYNHHYGKVVFKAYNEELSTEETQLRQKELVNLNKDLKQVHSFIINSKNELNWLLYRRAFEFQEYDKTQLKQIEKLAFKKNNTLALLHLKYNHTKLYKEKIDNYLKSDFLKTNFNSDNGIYYLHALIEDLLDSENESYINLALKKLKIDNSWKAHEEWFYETLSYYDQKL